MASSRAVLPDRMTHRIHHVSLRLEDNRTLHNDLVLRLGPDAWRADSYYLALDDDMLPESEDAGKVVAVLNRLLDQWAAAVAGLTDGGVVFLPYDFSDQCTAWLRCRLEGDMLHVQRGWSELEGWSFSPSQVGDLLMSVPDLKVEGDVYKIDRHAFLECLRGEGGD